MVEAAARADFSVGVSEYLPDEDDDAESWDDLTEEGKSLLLRDARAALKAAVEEAQK